MKPLTAGIIGAVASPVALGLAIAADEELARWSTYTTGLWRQEYLNAGVPTFHLNVEETGVTLRFTVPGTNRGLRLHRRRRGRSRRLLPLGNWPTVA